MSILNLEKKEKLIISCSNGFSTFAFLSKSYSWKKFKLIWTCPLKLNCSVWSLNVAARTQDGMDIYGFLNRKLYILLFFKVSKLEKKPRQKQGICYKCAFLFDFLATKKEGIFKQTKIKGTKSFQTKSNRNPTLALMSLNLRTTWAILKGLSFMFPIMKLYSFLIMYISLNVNTNRQPICCYVINMHGRVVKIDISTWNKYAWNSKYNQSP